MTTLPSFRRLALIAVLSGTMTVQAGCGLFADDYPDPRQSQAGGEVLDSERRGENRPLWIALGAIALGLIAAGAAAASD